MKITMRDVQKAAEENADKYTERLKHIGESAFMDGAVWALNMIKKEMQSCLER